MSALTASLLSRAQACELCGATDDLQGVPVPPADEGDADKAALLCPTCAAWVASGEVDGGHAFCLQGSAWSEVPAVQVLSWRLLHGLKEGWAHDLIEQIWMDEDTLAWAKAGLTGGGEDRAKVVDSNGAELADGDAVTLIKDLDVKGGGFTAKRGTLVKNIRLTDDPEHIEGKVNKQSIYLKTCFLKKA